MARDRLTLLKQFPNRVAWIVVGLFCLACLLPCIDGGPGVTSNDGCVAGNLDFESGWHFGLEILLLGWGGGNNRVPWSANIVLGLGLACLWLRRLRAAAVFGIMASALGLTTWWVRRYDTMMVGYYVWQASHLVLGGGAIWAIRVVRSQPMSGPIKLGK